MISTLTSYSSSSRVPKKGTRAAPSILLLLEDSVKSFFLGISVFLRELLSGKLLAVFKQAELGSSVEVSSYAGSVVPANVSVRSSSVPKKLKSRLDASTSEISAYEAGVHRLKEFFPSFSHCTQGLSIWDCVLRCLLRATFSELRQIRVFFFGGFL